MNIAVPPGYRIGRWEICEPLASGAFGCVYAARPMTADPDLPETAALKVLPTGTHTPRQLEHLRNLAERELEVLRRLRRPRLIKFYETLTVDDPARPELDGATVLVLERAENSLGALLEQRPAPVHPVLLVQICEGLAQLHQAGWVHGDLKPANVLLMADGTVRLADFNLSAELEGTHAYAPAFATLDYTSPELLWAEVSERGQLIRPTADIWALGVLVHLALTGTHPLPGGTPSARREAALRYARGDDELRLSAELGDEWRGIVADCLSRTHEERTRYRATSLLRRMESAARAERSPRLPRLRPRRVPRAPLATAAAAVALVPLGIGVFAVLDDDSGGAAKGVEEATGYDRCSEGNVCFFPEPGGEGPMCAWFGDDANWLAGDLACGWAEEQPARSAFNHGYDSGEKYVDVVYFQERAFEQRAGCLPVGTKVNFTHTDLTRSHRWAVRC